MWYVCDVLNAVFYVCVERFVMRGWAVSRRCNIKMFAIVMCLVLLICTMTI